jgi:PHD/YefM family antitoxin component YafN of YafNO toxin-antitoxin module
VWTEKGNLVVMSEAEYRGMIETLRIDSVPGLREEILEAMAEPLSESIPASEVQW